MPDFEALDPDAPATIEAVATAVMRLRAYDEPQLAELISQGRLRQVFPFRPHHAEARKDLFEESEVPEASPDPLTDQQYAALVQSSMPEKPRVSVDPQVNRLDEALEKSLKEIAAMQAELQQVQTTSDELRDLAEQLKRIEEADNLFREVKTTLEKRMLVLRRRSKPTTLEKILRRRSKTILEKKMSALRRRSPLRK